MANRDNHDKAMLKALQDIARELKKMNSNGNNQAIAETDSQVRCECPNCRFQYTYDLVLPEGWTLNHD